MTFYKRVLFCCLFFSAIVFNLRSQQGNTWYFGYNAGLDFSGGGPAPLTNGNISTWEGCSSISDGNGSLLFYTDGIRVWDRSHSIMLNGNGLMGDNSSVQSAFIAPYIGDKNKYYVFTTDGKSSSNSGPLLKYDGLKYSIIDMSLNAGFGDIVGGWKNRSLLDSTTEQVTAALHANGIDYWIITRKQFANAYYSFLVTCNGIDTANPVITVIGNTSSKNMNPFTQAYLKASPSSTAIVSGFNGGFNELYDFDRSTGVLSNAKILSMNTDVHYGVAFSPNDSIVYIGGGLSSTMGKIYRYNRFASSIPATEQITTFPGLANIGAIQQAPDGKLYFTHPLKNHDDSLGVINDPNNFSNPGIVYNQVYLGGKLSGYGLPNFFEIGFSQPFKTFAGEDVAVCTNSVIAIGSEAIQGLNYFWIPNTGLSNPAISNPLANPSSSTLYILGAYSICDTVYDSVFVTVNPDCFSIEELYIPNTFTPNGDGMNDFFSPKGTGIDPGDYELMIFDRWGNLIWQTTTLTEGWNGQANGSKVIAQTDVYVWKCNTKDIDTGKMHHHIGHVNLLR